MGNGDEAKIMIIQDTPIRNAYDETSSYNDLQHRNKIRCQVCGWPWRETGDSPAHPVNDTCWRHRPKDETGEPGRSDNPGVSDPLDLLRAEIRKVRIERDGLLCQLAELREAEANRGLFGPAPDPASPGMPEPDPDPQTDRLVTLVKRLGMELAQSTASLHAVTTERDELNREIRKYHEWAEEQKSKIDHIRNIETRETMMRYELDALRKKTLADMEIIGALRGEIVILKAETVKWKSFHDEAAGELMVRIPTDTDLEKKLLIANGIMRQERDNAREERNAALIEARRFAHDNANLTRDIDRWLNRAKTPGPGRESTA